MLKVCLIETILYEKLAGRLSSVCLFVWSSSIPRHFDLVQENVLNKSFSLPLVRTQWKSEWKFVVKQKSWLNFHGGLLSSNIFLALRTLAI